MLRREALDLIKRLNMHSETFLRRSMLISKSTVHNLNLQSLKSTVHNFNLLHRLFPFTWDVFAKGTYWNIHNFQLIYILAFVFTCCYPLVHQFGNQRPPTWPGRALSLTLTKITRGIRRVTCLWHKLLYADRSRLRCSDLFPKAEGCQIFDPSVSVLQSSF